MGVGGCGAANRGPFAHAAAAGAYPLSTLRFVREALCRIAPGNGLRDRLILASMAAGCCWHWACAASARGQSLLAEETKARCRESSCSIQASMAAEEHGIGCFERARAKAATFLQYRTGLRANLLFRAAASPQAVFDVPSTNLQDLHDELIGAACGPNG